MLERIRILKGAFGTSRGFQHRHTKKTNSVKVLRQNRIGLCLLLKNLKRGAETHIGVTISESVYVNNCELIHSISLCEFHKKPSPNFLSNATNSKTEQDNHEY